MIAPPNPKSLGPRVLRGRFIVLEPLGPEHEEELARAGADSEIWRYMPFDVERTGVAEVLARCAAETRRGTQIAFAVRRLADSAIVGSTSYLAITPEHARVEIGMTWYARSAQATEVNPEAKYLLLGNAFASGYHRVEFKTDANNARSRAALTKLGAKEEGILRGHMWVEKGYFRDSVYFSILETEWPHVEAALLKRLVAPTPGKRQY